MKKSTVALVPAVLLLVGGCAWFQKPAKPPIGVERHTTTTDGLALTIELPRRSFTAGEAIDVRIIARNVGVRAMEFETSTNALHRVTVWRKTGLDWRWVNSYPKSTMKVKRSWRLLPGQTVKYNQVVPVERDWPVDEPLRLVAELIGGPDARCPMIIEVIPATQDKP